MKMILALTLVACFGAPALAATPAETKVMVTRFYEEVINQYKFDQAVQFIDPKAIDHDLMADPKMTALDNFKMAMKMMHTAFPDMKIKIEDMVLEGDKVVVRYRMLGTHLGDFNGVPATRRKVDMPGVDIMRINNGKFVEHWNFMDSMLMMQQLGLLPE